MHVFIDIIFVIIGLHAYWHNSLLNPYFNSDHYLCVSSSLGLITEPLIEQGRWCYLDGRACNFDDISQSESRDFWSKVNEHIKNLKVRKWDVMFLNPSSATLVRRRSNDLQVSQLIFSLPPQWMGWKAKSWSLIDMHNMSRYADCIHAHEMWTVTNLLICFLRYDGGGRGQDLSQKHCNSADI